MKFCTKCGKQILPDKNFCTYCGNIVTSENIEEKNRETVEEPIIKQDNIKKVEVVEKPIKNSDKSEPVKAKERSIDSGNHKKSSSKLIPKIILGVILALLILGGIFFKNIKGGYYIYKYDNSIIISEKMEYATKAVQTLKSNKAKDLLKNALVEMSKTDVPLAETKLQEISSFLSQGEYQSIASDIKEKKIDKLYSEGKYKEALKEFDEVNKLGGDFRSNENYEDIMLNIVSDLTGTTLQSTKGMLLKNANIYFDNFDEDIFDEIVQLENSYAYNSELSLNLYKFSNGQYKLVDNVTVNSAYYPEIQGVYDYAKDKKGIFASYSTYSYNSNNIGTSVYGVTNGKLEFKGTIFANNYTKPDDIDKDGIYEVLSNSISVISSADKGTSKWYKLYEDARTPTEVVATAKQVANSNINTGDYILPNSDNQYLKESDLESLSKEQLALARNEIFARHGYVFTMDEFKDYFTTKSWYSPNPSYDGSDSTLNEYEIANYKLIQELEKK